MGLLEPASSFKDLFSSMNDFNVYALQMRNHYGFMHTKTKEEMNYNAMAEDVANFMQFKGIKKAFIIGYCIGGRIAIHFSHKYPNMINGLILLEASGLPV